MIYFNNMNEFRTTDKLMCARLRLLGVPYSFETFIDHDREGRSKIKVYHVFMFDDKDVERETQLVSGDILKEIRKLTDKLNK